MKNRAFAVVKHITKNSHLHVVKMEATVLEVYDLEGETIYTVETKGMSQRNHVGYTTYNDFPFTEEGLTDANKLAEELNNWR